MMQDPVELEELRHETFVGHLNEVMAPREPHG